MNKKTLKKHPGKVVETKKQERKKSKNSLAMTKMWQKRIDVSALIAFILIAIYYLPVLNKNVLFKIQELSIFLPTEYFFEQQMKVSGGFLSWLGTFFTQFFYYPWLGSTLFILLTLLVQFFAIKAFRIPARFYLLTFIIPFALILSTTQLGYMIYAIKLQGYVFVNLFGLSAILVALWTYKKIPTIIARTFATGIFVFFFYTLLGIYALVGAGLFCFYEITELIKNKRSVHLIPILTGIVFVIIVPYALNTYHYTQTEPGRIYLAGLPVLYEPEKFCWIPYTAICISIVTFSFLPILNIKKENNPITLSLCIIIYLLSVYGLTRYSFRDENFQTEIAMDHAIFENRWEDVLKLARQHKDEPTRLIVMETNMALQKLGRGGDEMFSYKNGCKDTNSPWPSRLISIAGKLLYYNYGRIDFSYHWCMEDMVERGVKIEDLRYMVKCSLLKHELKLAQRYNDLLKQTLFYKDWAQKYQKYIDNPSLMSEDPEFCAIRPLTAFDDELSIDNGALELYLMNLFPQTESRTSTMLEIAIQNSLIIKSSEFFWPKYFEYIHTHERVPRHYQEAALLYGYFERKVDISKLKFEAKTLERFQELIRMCEQNVNNPKDVNRKIFASKFGDTFWFYHFFGVPLKAD